MSIFDSKKMYWHNGAKMTVKKMNEENQKRLDPETIRKINDRVEELAETINTKLKEPDGLKDWQKEIIRKNGN